MRTRRWILVSVLLVSVLVLPLASAANGAFSAQFVATGTAQMDGPLGNVSLKLAGLTLSAPPGGARMALEASGAVAQMVNIPVQRIVANPPALRPFESIESLPPEEGPVFRLDLATLEFRAASPESQVRFLPASGGAFSLAEGAALESLRVAPRGALPAVPENSSFARVDSVLGHSAHPESPFALGTAPPAGPLLFAADVVILVGGPTVFLPGASAAIDTGYSLNATRSWTDPATGTGREVYDNRFLVIRASPFAVRCEGCLAELAWRHLEADVDGKILWHGLAGEAQVDGAPLGPDPETLEASGSFSSEAKWTAQGVAWEVEGTSDWVNVDARPAWRDPDVVVGAAGALAVAVGFALLGKLRLALGFVAGRVMAGSHGDVLRNASRRKILAAIHEVQPATLLSIQGATGLPRGTLRYHLSVLVSSQVLQAARPSTHRSRGESFMLNSGSLMHAVPGLAPPSEGGSLAGQVLAAVNSNPIRRAILERLLASGPCDYEGLKAHLVAAGIVADWPQSSASYHLGAMLRAGAIAEAWQGRRKVYRASIDPAGERLSQYRMYLSGHGLGGLLGRLVASAGALRSELLGQMRPSTRREERILGQRLDLLLALGLAREDRDGRLHPTPFASRLAASMGGSHAQ